MGKGQDCCQLGRSYTYLISQTSVSAALPVSVLPAGHGEGGDNENVREDSSLIQKDVPDDDTDDDSETCDSEGYGARRTTASVLDRPVSPASVRRRSSASGAIMSDYA